MKFVFAPDSFKGTLTSLQVAEILTKEARKIFDDVTTVSVQIADGGEGTLETLVDQTNCLLYTSETSSISGYSWILRPSGRPGAHFPADQ